MKASQLDATQTIHYVYNDFYYDFIPDDSIPTGYEFNSDVIEYVISKGADAINAYQTQRFGKVINAGANFIGDIIYSLMRNTAIAIGYLNAEYIDANASIYTWHYECTGIDTDYEFSGEYGTAYGFKFVGICDEVFTLVLDQNGGFYGSEKIGNWTYSTGTAEIINQIAPQYDPNVINVPTSYTGNFGDLPQPYFEGKKLHFFVKSEGVTYHLRVEDYSMLTAYVYCAPHTVTYFFMDLSSTSPGRTVDIYRYDNQQTYSATCSSTRTKYTNWRPYNITSQRYYVCSLTPVPVSSSYSVNFPFTYNGGGVAVDFTQPYNKLGILDRTLVSGSSDLFLYSLPTTPTETPSNPNPAPINVPIPVTEIPSDPEDPIPQNPDPDNVPGVPVNPVPIPLPPFATIVSGNDDLWGVTLDFEGAQYGLLPYMNSLSEFEFPSFSDLISDFSGSIIWVAQLMSILYNGTPLNVLFIALCLFSLVSVLIGAYKLWNSTEPDPGNPGMRRYKRPPKGGKKH